HRHFVLAAAAVDHVLEQERLAVALGQPAELQPHQRVKLGVFVDGSRDPYEPARLIQPLDVITQGRPRRRHSKLSCVLRPLLIAARTDRHPVSRLVLRCRRDDNALREDDHMIPYTPPKPAEYIPIVDLRGTLNDPKARAAAAWEIHKAARDTGFFYVGNHGIDQGLIDRVFAQSQRFFALPVEDKLRVALKNWPCRRGYEPLLAQQLDQGSPQDLKEIFTLGTDLGPDHPHAKAKLPNHGPNQWPDFLPGFRGGVEAYYLG